MSADPLIEGRHLTKRFGGFVAVDAVDFRVERDLRVTVEPSRPSVGPGDEAEFVVTTVDQLGRPVAAEVYQNGSIMS